MDIIKVSLLDFFGVRYPDCVSNKIVDAKSNLFGKKRWYGAYNVFEVDETVYDDYCIKAFKNFRPNS